MHARLHCRGIENALTQAGRGDLVPEVDFLKQSLFDPDFEPLITAKSPQRRQGHLAGQRQQLLSRREPGGSERIRRALSGSIRAWSRASTASWSSRFTAPVRPTATFRRASTPLYLRKANDCLAKARAYAEPRQQKVIDDLIRYYQTGEFKDWIQFDIDWVQDDEPVDFANGFIEVYRDARGAKGSSQAFVTITDQKLSATMLKIADNAQYFEDNAPWNAAL